MNKWEPSELTIKTIKEQIESIKNKNCAYPTYINYKIAKLLQIWLNNQEAKNNPDSDNLLEK
jgi:hypothetical protein